MGMSGHGQTSPEASICLFSNRKLSRLPLKLLRSFTPDMTYWPYRPIEGNESQLITVNPLKVISEFTKTVLDEPSPDILLSHIALKTLSHLDCRGVILGVIKREGFLDLIGSYGYEDKAVSPFMRIPLWTPMPITDAVRNGEISIFKSPKEMVLAYPHLAEYGQVDQGVTISAPIKYRNAVVGAIGFTSMQPPRAEFMTSEVTETVLALCGLYVKNILNSKSENDRDHVAAAQSLTPRQKQIIRLFAEDLTTDQMADRLRYSPSTIKQDIIKIYSIFGVNSRSAVLDLAKKAGLTEISSAG